MTSKRKTAKPSARAMRAGGAVPEIPLDKLDDMISAVSQHRFSRDTEGCEPLDDDMADKVYAALRVLRRIMSTGKITPPVRRANPEHLLATAVARDLRKKYKCKRDFAILAAFPNADIKSLNKLIGRFKSTLPLLARTPWSYGSPPTLLVTCAYAAGFFSEKALQRFPKSAWAAEYLRLFRKEVDDTAKLNRK